jgi:glucosyl-dolichyl phosphate glucuronosyltransferase
MNITVVICTYNRSGSLATTLTSVAAMAVSESVEWEVLVVDNNSTDKTRDLCERFCGRYPGRFRYLFEPQQGLSHARNAGIREARGQIIAFTDDDVTVETTWLQNLTADLLNEEWAGAGGRILPARQFTLPKWLSARTLREGGALPIFDAGETECSLNQAPYGANMAYRKCMFKRYGLFRTELGRQGDNLISSEDVEFGRRLLQAGERLRYVSSATVYHAVSEERLCREYFQSWWFGLGRSSVLLYGRGRDVLGIPRSYFSIVKQSLRLFINAVCWAFGLRAGVRFYSKLQVWNSAGAIFELHRQLSPPLKPESVLQSRSSTNHGS